MFRGKARVAAALFLLLFFTVGCNAGPLITTAPDPGATATRTPKPTFTSTPLATTAPTRSPTAEPTRTRTPSPTPEETPTPEAEGTEEATEEATAQPTPLGAGLGTRTVTATPRATSAATATPAPSPTSALPTNTPAPTLPPPTPTETPLPTEPPATATPSQPFTGTLIAWEPNCAGTQVKGRVTDSAGNPLGGVAVRVLIFNQQFGSPPVTNGAGEYELNRFGTSDATAPTDYSVAVVDASTGALLSNVINVSTDNNDCGPGGSGHQIAIINFIRN